VRTREGQIAEALALLAPAPERLSDCRRDIECKLDQVERRVKMQTAAKKSKTKTGKAALRCWCKALHDIRSAYEGLGDLRPWFSPPNEIALEHDLDTASALLKAKPGAAKRSARLAKAAVPLACALLLRWGHKPAVTRGGTWECLTKILANTDASAFEHIRNFKKKAKPVFGKFSAARASA
jgi:hypothetical protein